MSRQAGHRCRHAATAWRVTARLYAAVGLVLALAAVPVAGQEPPTFAGGFRTIATIQSQLAATAAAHPDIVELIDYGDSYSKAVGGVITPGGDHITGYDLLAMKITLRAKPGPKPPFILLGGTHGREVPSAEVAMRFVDWLVNGYGHDADATWLVDEHEIWVVPVVNPDGHWYAELGTRPPYSGAPFPWRKNGNPQGSRLAPWPPTTKDTYGVDLNRNSTFMWGAAGASSNPDEWDYKGPAAGSEPETSATEHLLLSLLPAPRPPVPGAPAPDTTSGILVSLHTGFTRVAWPWCYTSTPAPNAAQLGAIGRKLAAFNGYSAGQWWSVLYPASGTIDDWLYGLFGVPAFTIEMGAHFPTMAGLDTMWSRNRGALVYAAKIARTPYLTVRGPDVRDLAFHVVDAATLVITATASDATSGGETIGQAEVYVDNAPWASGATPQPLAAGDGAFDETVEGLVGAVRIADSGAGRHLLYVRARDASGHWGPVSALLYTASASGDPVGRWRLDENGGLVAFDASPLRNDLTLANGTTWAPGVAGSALEFDGLNDVTSVVSTSFDAMPAVSVSAWIHPRSGGATGKGRVVDKAEGTTPTRGWIFSQTGDGTSLSFHVDYSGTDLARVSVAGALKFDTWQHVAVTWDGTSSATGVHLHVDGREVGYSSTRHGTGSRIADGGQALKVGNAKATTRGFDGFIDELAVWNRPLSAAEVLALSVPPAAAPIAAWRFDEGSGTTASDASEAPSDLVLANGTAWTIGHAGTAVDFDGANDVATAAATDKFDAMTALSVSAWILPHSGGEGNRGRIVDKARTTTPTNGWAFNLSGDGTTLSFAMDFSSSDLKRQSVPGAIAFGAWQHVAVTWEGSPAATSVRLYVDGIEVDYAASTGGSGVRADDSLQDLRIGNDRSLFRTFDGAIDDVRIWDRALTAAEVNSLSR